MSILSRIFGYRDKTTQAGLELEQAAIDLAGTVKEINAQLRASFGLDAEELAQPAAIAETNGKTQGEGDCLKQRTLFTPTQPPTRMRGRNGASRFGFNLDAASRTKHWGEPRTIAACRPALAEALGRLLSQKCAILAVPMPAWESSMCVTTGVRAGHLWGWPAFFCGRIANT